MSTNLDQQADSSSANNDLKTTLPELPNANSEEIYPKGIALALIFVSLCSSTFLVALDATIIATAIPTITSQFNSLEDVSWYNSAMLLTSCAFQLPYGRAYRLFDTKWVFFSAIAIFELGSIICGTSPNSIALIIGRAIAGKIPLPLSQIIFICFNSTTRL